MFCKFTTHFEKFTCELGSSNKIFGPVQVCKTTRQRINSICGHVVNSIHVTLFTNIFHDTVPLRPWQSFAQRNLIIVLMRNEYFLNINSKITSSIISYPCQHTALLPSSGLTCTRRHGWTPSNLPQPSYSIREVGV